MKLPSAALRHDDALAEAARTAQDPREGFIELLRTALRERQVNRLLLGKYRGAEPGLQRVLVRPIALRGEASLSFVYRHATRDVTRNLPLAAGIEAVRELIAHDFEHAHLLTPSEDIQLAVNRRGLARLQRGRVTADVPSAPAETAAHDRDKRRWIDPHSPWLTDLGITDAQQRLVPAMARKWKQINQFVEVLDPAFAALRWPAERPVRVLDFGSGKGYLTFALHEHLTRTLGLQARVTGIELREDLVRVCNAAAARLATPGLAFEQGDVRRLAPGEVDVMIALHACDTATDHALHAGIRAGASLILSAPCCHKQLRPQMHGPPLLAPLLQHGIHLGQQAEMLTDGLRALLLEAEGYDTQVFEFVSLEHTSKNKMILAARHERAVDAEALRQQIRELKAFYGVREQCLEALLERDRAAPGDTGA